MAERELLTQRQVVADVIYGDGRRERLDVTASLYSDRTATYRLADGRNWEEIDDIEQVTLPTAFDDVWD